MSSVYKKCPSCSSNNIVKNGFQSKRQVFKCKNCGKRFQSKSQKNRRSRSAIHHLTFKKTIQISRKSMVQILELLEQSLTRIIQYSLLLNLLPLISSVILRSLENVRIRTAYYSFMVQMLLQETVVYYGINSQPLRRKQNTEKALHILSLKVFTYSL